MSSQFALKRFAVFREPPPPPPEQPPFNLVSVPAGTSLQTAINNAQPFDMLELDAGATYLGNFSLPPKANWVGIRGAGAGAFVVSPTNVPAFQTAAQSSFWRFENLTIRSNSALGDLVRVGTSTHAADAVPHDFVFFNVWFQGNAVTGGKRGLALNGAFIEVRECTFTDFKLEGQDTQAMIGWNGPGPFVIDSCLIEAASENLLFGGADPSILDLIPTGITVTNNTFRHPLSWKAENWVIKNLFELKVGKNVLVENNLFEDHWGSAHAPDGFAVWMKSVNQDGGQPWAQVEDVTFRNNIFQNISAGFAIQAQPSNAGNFGLPFSGLVIENNFFDITQANGFGGRGYFMRNIDVDDVHVIHNTVIQTGDITVAFDLLLPCERNIFRDNILMDLGLGFKGADRPEGILVNAGGDSTFSTYLPGVVWAGNLFQTNSSSAYPVTGGNNYVADLVAAGYVSGTRLLDGGSAYKGTATDGTDPGWNGNGGPL